MPFNIDVQILEPTLYQTPEGKAITNRVYSLVSTVFQDLLPPGRSTTGGNSHVVVLAVDVDPGEMYYFVEGMCGIMDTIAANHLDIRINLFIDYRTSNTSPGAIDRQCLHAIMTGFNQHGWIIHTLPQPMGTRTYTTTDSEITEKTYSLLDKNYLFLTVKVRRPHLTGAMFDRWGP